MTEEERLTRRIIHSIVWIVLVYYLIPDPLFGYPRSFFLVLVLAIVLVFEGFRLYFGFSVYGMREYEKRQFASYAWASLAAAITLLFFPMHLAFVCLLGMGLIDPLIGEIQHHKPELYPYVPFLAWLFLALFLLSLLGDFSLPMIITLSIIGATSAILAEYPTLRIDDDFLMIIVPLFVLRGIELILA
ncbi:MAG: hypothetical protein KGY66_08370 [Candidatus Thermoplasmatota archaeon]|nr:hypothetical protein [Candidatus Thermoplasmatota archaeon]MBS3790910.1 hypothetical protein [Candidatus Thermoplasmatota archaeon]